MYTDTAIVEDNMKISSESRDGCIILPTYSTPENVSKENGINMDKMWNQPRHTS